MSDKAVHPKRWLVSAAICCTIAIAACGSSGPGSTATATGSSTLAMLDQYSICMRDHGVSGFPDPGTNETSNSFGIDGYNFDLPSTINAQAPAYESADKTCQSVLGRGTSSSGPSATVLAKARKAALAHAECMREHGVPNFPDPHVSSSGGGITVGQSAAAGMNPRSPAFQQAQKLCAPTGSR